MPTPDDNNDEAPESELQQAELEAIKEGLSQLQNGEGIPHEEVIRKLKAELNIIVDA